MGIEHCKRCDYLEADLHRLREENARHLETIRQQQDNSVAISEYAEQVRRERDEARALAERIHDNTSEYLQGERTCPQADQTLERIHAITKPEEGTS